MKRITLPIVCGLLTGCFTASDFRQEAHQKNLSAARYEPSVYVEPGYQERYDKILPICRRLAEKRELTAAQQAELQAEANITTGAVQGAVTGLTETMFLDSSDIGGSVAGGLLAGVIGSAVAESGQGTVATASATRVALLNCLKATSNGGEFWTVIE